MVCCRVIYFYGFYLMQNTIQKSGEINNVIAGAFFCRADEFICNNTLCKLHTWVCDGKDDCGDNSDEDTDMCGGLKLSLTRLFFEDNWWIFYKPLSFYYSRGTISLSFHTSFQAVVFLGVFLVSPLKDVSISFLCLFNSSKTLLPSYKAIPLQKWSCLSTCWSSVQQGGWLWWQLGWRWVWWGQNCTIAQPLKDQTWPKIKK